MKFTRELPSNIHLVRSYQNHQVRIGDRSVESNCVFDAQNLHTPWRPQSLKELSIQDFELALSWEPEIILLGSNEKTFPERALYAEMAKRRVGFEVMDIGAACRTYNVLVNENRRAVIGLIF
jgi:uncharacterized protein